ncbi:hypothetical protein DFQ14_10854 [Halopolyspora algeriensis]|uniref:Uncharacterized protein n=1 Tax=Halopolyspora algeriensis TaxID=1500506 RepID=A0A368VMP1_9ACTN|nr:hypothetical protein DFQ14_10854 [Halopolyspora algeriensis]TQM56732.1 hypothetical protein FHU43_1546 [Halopolyspora algeriensis]
MPPGCGAPTAGLRPGTESCPAFRADTRARRADLGADALTLMLIVMLLNLVARLITLLFSPENSR